MCLRRHHRPEELLDGKLDVNELMSHYGLPKPACIGQMATGVYHGPILSSYEQWSGRQIQEWLEGARRLFAAIR